MTERRRFPREARLRRSDEIRGVMRRGRRTARGPLQAFVAPAGAERARVAVVVPRHGRTAVQRNRLKRRLREILRLRWLPGAPPRDVVLRAGPRAYGRSFAELERSVLRCLSDTDS
ncbi:MAG: ribonuclease P protein component [Gemmatimonadota bacterium]|nr:ribonuclease P protein component [Gemmatimonadota bacterium]